MDRCGILSLTCYAKIGDTDKIINILHTNENLKDEKDAAKRSICHWSAWYGRIDVVSYLLGVEADFTAKDIFGQTPLIAATRSGHPEIVKLFFAKLPSIRLNEEDNFGYTPLMCAVSSEKCRYLTKDFIELGFDVNKSNYSRYTPMHRAVKDENIQLVQLLLNSHADVNKRDNLGKTPLHISVDQSSYKIIKLLIENGADVDETDEKNRSPIDWSISRGNLKMEKRLSKTSIIRRVRR